MSVIQEAFLQDRRGIVRPASALSGRLQLAVLQSGIDRLDGDHSWLADARLINTLVLVSQVHEGEGFTKHHQHELSCHEIWVADRTFNFALNLGLSRDGALRWAAKALIHDYSEAKRAKESRNGSSLPPNSRDEFEIAASEILANCYALLDREEIIVNQIYFTDEEGLHGPKRTQRQRQKGLDVDGKVNIPLDFQVIRAFDKLWQSYIDCDACEKGLIPVEKIQTSINKLNDKGYILAFPICSTELGERMIARPYERNIAIMGGILSFCRKTGSQTHTSSPRCDLVA